jgi:tRNA (guanine-N7-)-methyltransferase
MSDDPNQPDLRGRPLRSFGRQKGRPMTARQQGLMDALLPTIAVPEAPPAPFDPRALMPHAQAVHFEIGFGGGEHLAARAEATPDTLHLGAEPFVDGVAKLLTRIDAQGLANVRVLHGDARPLLKALTPSSLDRLVVLFPDPWHKARHNKRRLIQRDFLDDAARALKPGGEFRFATDWAAYADWTLAMTLAHPGFDWSAERADDWRTPPPDHVVTRYQTKGLGDCAPIFLRFTRV